MSPICRAWSVLRPSSRTRRFARRRGLIEGAGNRQPARAALLGIEAVLPGGHRATFGSAAMKDVAGLDAKRLIAGGHGAFGRVERVTLRAMPRPR